MEFSITPAEQAELEDRDGYWSLIMDALSVDEMKQSKTGYVPDTLEDGIDVMQITRGMV